MKVNSDFTKILTEEHQGKWVALSKNHDRVIDYDDDLVILIERLGNQKDNVVYHKVLRFDMEYAFSDA